MRSVSSDEKLTQKARGAPKQEQEQMVFIAESDLGWYSIII